MNASSSTGSSPNTTKTKLLVASDHAGFELKQWLKTELPGIEWVDLGPDDDGRVDYPDFADHIAKRVSQDPTIRGLLICGSGQGMAMRANKYASVRAALVWNEESTRLSRAHNDANVLCLGARMVSKDLAKGLVELFMNTPFEGGRHQDRVSKLARSTDDC